jgi:DNA-binding MarR family transcriptional regulator
MTKSIHDIPTGTQTLILSKLYYGVLTKSLEKQDIDRYFSVVLFLNENKDCCQQEICNALMIDKTAMVKVIDYLSKHGCVERKTNPRDRREHTVVLSKKGEKLAKDIVRIVKHIEHKAFEGVSKHDEENFKKILSNVTLNLKGMPFNDLFFNYKNTSKNTKTKNDI